MVSIRNVMVWVMMVLVMILVKFVTVKIADPGIMSVKKIVLVLMVDRLMCGVRNIFRCSSYVICR